MTVFELFSAFPCHQVCFSSPVTEYSHPGTSGLDNVRVGWGVVFLFCLVECKDEKEDTSLRTEHSVEEKEDAVGGDGTGSSALSAFHSTVIKEEAGGTLVTEDRISPVKNVEEDGQYCTLQAPVSTSQDSVAIDGQLHLASECGQLSDFLSDVKAVPPLSVVEFTEESTCQSGSHELCENCYPGGMEKEAKRKKSNYRNGMCAERPSTGIPGDLCRQDVCGLATRRSSKCASAPAMAQQSYKVPSVLESGSSHDRTKGRNAGILPPVRKKSRTFYSAGRYRGSHWQTVTLVMLVVLMFPSPY